MVGLATLLILRGVRRFLPKLPAPMVALVAAVALVKGLGLDLQGVMTIGPVPAGLPSLQWTRVPPELLVDLAPRRSGWRSSA